MQETDKNAVRTREKKHEIRKFDRHTQAAKGFKKAYIRTRELSRRQEENSSETPERYAGETVQNAASRVVHGTGSAARRTQNNIRKRIEDRFDRRRRERLGERQKARAKSGARPVNHEAVRNGNLPKQTVRRAAKPSAKASVKTSARGSVRTARRTVKTAQQTSKTVIRTSRAAAKTAQKTTQTTVKAGKTAAVVMKKSAAALYKAAILIGKAAAAAAKAFAAAMKALYATIAAGGWVAVVIIVVVLLVALIAGSAYGIFYANEEGGDGKTLSSVVREIHETYQTRIEDIKKFNAHDEVRITGSAVSWPEVLSVYAVEVNCDPENPREVVTLTEEKIETLEEIFWVMDDVSYHVETQTAKDGPPGENPGEEPDEKQKTVLFIEVSHLTVGEAAELYEFTGEQNRMLGELLDPKNRILWSEVLYGIGNGDGRIVEVARSQIGNAGGQPYWSWYGFDARVEWCACFVSWCANECGYIEEGIVPKYAGCMAGVNWFRERGQWADHTIVPSPGMIIFYDWDDPYGFAGPQDGWADHTGIVEKVEGNVIYTIEGNYGDRCAENRTYTGNYEILGYGIPAY